VVAMSVNTQLDPSHGMFLINKLIERYYTQTSCICAFYRDFIMLIDKSVLLASQVDWVYVIGF
jgi:hypothetical protein